MNVYRIHIRPGGGKADMQTTFQYCLENKMLGVGWRVRRISKTKDWNEYYNEAKDIHGNLSGCEYIQKWVREGDLVWTRDPDGNYYLARVTSSWEYWTSQESIELDIDIANVFRCDIQQIESRDTVPGKIIACFRAPRTIQATYDGNAIAFSKHLWNKLSKENIYAVSKSEYSDIFSLLDDEETEDVVFMYLQTEGWFVVPNSRKRDTMSFEYLLIDRSTHKRAWVQVKTGNSTINVDDYRDNNHITFLFQSNEDYDGTSFQNVDCIRRDVLLNFMREKKDLLPGSIQNKLDILER